MQSTDHGDLRLFFSYAYREDTKNAVDVLKEVASDVGFDVVTGDPPSIQSPPNYVRGQILGSDCFAALLTPGESEGQLSPWVSNEIGIAYGADLPLFLCKDERVKDIGLARYAVGFLRFKHTDLKGFKDALRESLGSFANEVRRDRPSSLAAFILRLVRDAAAGRIPAIADDQKKIDEMANLLAAVVEEYRLHNRAFGESDSFAKRRELQLGAKQALAKFIVDILAGERESTVFMDSGTTTYAVCEELVARGLRIPVITNNLASGRLLARIPKYPLVILPGRLDTTYVASLGSEAVQYAISRLGSPADVKLAVVAATAFTSTAGLCGHDEDHRALKRAVLTHSNDSIIVFAGEKLLEERGGPVFGSVTGWQAFVRTKRSDGSRLRILTHYPENWDKLPASQRTLFCNEIDALGNSLGTDNVTVLGKGGS